MRLEALSNTGLFGTISAPSFIPVELFEMMINGNVAVFRIIDFFLEVIARIIFSPSDITACSIEGRDDWRFSNY